MRDGGIQYLGKWVGVVSGIPENWWEVAAGDDTDGVREEKAEKQRKNPALQKLYAATLRGLTRKDNF